MQTLWNHIVPFILFGALGLALLGYAFRGGTQWLQTGVWRVQNRLTWMPFGSAAHTAIGLASREDRLKDRRVYELKSAWLVVLWLIVCVTVGVFALAGAYEFLRLGHGFGNANSG